MSYTNGAELSKRGKRGRFTMEYVLRRVLLGRPTIHLPKVLWGKRFRIVLVADCKEGI